MGIVGGSWDGDRSCATDISMAHLDDNHKRGGEMDYLISKLL